MRRSQGEAVPTPADIAMSATRRAELLQGRIKPLNIELSRLVQEMQSAKQGSATRQRYKTRAKQVLRQKKTLEKRLEQALNQQFNMAMIQDAVEAREAAQNDEALYASMRASLGTASTAADSEALRETFSDIEEVQNILEEPLDGVAFDDTELDAELEAELARDGHSATTPSAPTTSLSWDAQRVAALSPPTGPTGPLSNSDELFTRSQSTSPTQQRPVFRRGNSK